MRSIPHLSSGFSYPPSQQEAPDQSPIERSLRFRGQRGVLALVVTVLLLLGAAIGYYNVVPMVTQGDAQMAAVRQFCADEVSRDYAGAYGLLASGYTQTFALDSTQFVQQLQQRDARHGPVQMCTITGRDYVGTFASTAFFTPGFVFRVTDTLGDGGHSGSITAVDDHGWKIRYLDAQLHLDR